VICFSVFVFLWLEFSLCFTRLKFMFWLWFVLYYVLVICFSVVFIVIGIHFMVFKVDWNLCFCYDLFCTMFWFVEIYEVVGLVVLVELKLKFWLWICCLFCVREFRVLHFVEKQWNMMMWWWECCMGSRIRVGVEDEKGAERGMPSFNSDDAWYIS
jgi:hypothetical protein